MTTPITFHPSIDLTGVSAETICRALVDVCLSRGYVISIESEGETDLKDSTDPEAIWEAINAVEMCELTARTPDLPQTILWTLLTPYEGDCVICDYNSTQTTEDIIHAAQLAARPVAPPRQLPVHLHVCPNGDMAIFDAAERLVVDCTAGHMSKADAERFVAVLNQGEAA